MEQILIQKLGIRDCCNPRKAKVNWDAVQDLISKYPELAKVQCGKNGIYFPLNLAICNSAFPALAELVKMLIVLNPDALTGDSFELACANPNLSGDVFDAILCRKGELLTHWSMRQVAFYENTKVAKCIICDHPHVLPRVCRDWSLIFGNSTQSFWLRAMLELGSDCVSEENVIAINMVHYFAAQSNLDAVERLVERYPCTLSNTHMGRLPIHEALSNYSGRAYGWNAILVRFLLEAGYKHNIGKGEGGYGGLFVEDKEGKSPIESAIQMIHYLSFSEDTGMCGERWECLLVCIQFMHRRTGGHENDTLFHAALATIPFAVEILDLIAEHYEIDISLPNVEGQHCIGIAIGAITHGISQHFFEKDATCENIFKRILGGKYKGAGKHLASTKDANGNLPLVQALDAGLKWNRGLFQILNAYPIALDEMDSRTGLYPFMISSMGSQDSESNSSSFEMLRQFPNPLLYFTNID